MASFVVTEVTLYKVEGNDKDDALVNFHANEDNQILDIEVQIEPN